jgi:hypothetical protein
LGELSPCEGGLHVLSFPMWSMKHSSSKGNNKNLHHHTAKSCLSCTYTFYLTYRLFPKLDPITTAYTFIPTLVYGHTCIKEHRCWFIRAKHLGVADKGLRIADAPDL